MNKKKFLLLILILIVIIVILVNLNKNNNDTKYLDEGYIFVNDGKKIKVGQEFSRKDFGQELEYLEVFSCAFEGKDKIYKYENFEIITAQIDGKEKIFSICLLNDKVATNEGICIADTYKKMVEKYSANFIKDNNMYTYTKNDVNLKFIVENEIITSIEYSLIVDNK